MSPPRSDWPPEQRWRRTLDLRMRPATLKVSGLLQDFGFTKLTPSAAETIETRLATVGLTVEPSLEVAAVGDIITIRRGVRPSRRRSSATPTKAPSQARPRSDPGPRSDPAPGPRPGSRSDAGAGSPARPREAPVDARATQRITVLENELRDARSELERLRAELEDRSLVERASAADGQPTPHPDGAMTDEQRREWNELIEALNETHVALTATRSDIRECSASLEQL